MHDLRHLKPTQLSSMGVEQLQMPPLSKLGQLLLAFVLAFATGAYAEEANEDSFGNDTNDEKKYLDCQYGQGKWISITYSPGSSLAVGQINDGAPVFFTSLLSGNRLSLTPRQPGKKLTINLSSLIVTREWYLRDGAGSAGTGECVKGETADSTFSDDDF